ncbi:ECF RNA polymerase sigma factor SigK [Solicola gregarius]|uniref:RNA polymerase sigma factor n=1 Tax=Solicola gregarius TaxID=2908642 RepID=A0AA46TG42_9ACTN|nr:ECF RNA polymerase sigma factor SigK [Solicola gregarius]UYM04615.1 ECF RNA polymerase sigma factor SigK [Solicola gregarius]
MPKLRVVPDASGEPGDAIGTLLNRASRGDVAAFERIYDELGGAVLGIAVRVLRNRAIAEEVAQEVLVEVWRRAARYEPERGSGKSWIMTIAHRRAVDRVRHEQAMVNRDVNAATAAGSRPFDEVSETVETGLEREQVRRCLDGLTDLQRESVALAYYDGYTYREVSRLLDSPLGTIKTRMRDGLARLRDCMGVA